MLLEQPTGYRTIYIILLPCWHYLTPMSTQCLRAEISVFTDGRTLDQSYKRSHLWWVAKWSSCSLSRTLCILLTRNWKTSFRSANIWQYFYFDLLPHKRCTISYSTKWVQATTLHILLFIDQIFHRPVSERAYSLGVPDFLFVQNTNTNCIQGNVFF